MEGGDAHGRRVGEDEDRLGVGKPRLALTASLWWGRFETCLGVCLSGVGDNG